jgi:hypothetical protein
MCQAMRDGRRVLAAPFVALALASCVTEASRLDAAKVVTGVEIAPYAIYEECIALQPGERIGYRFNVEPHVAFNVHFNEANAIIMPVNVMRTGEEAGDFIADRAQTYCLMWEAGPAAAVLNYRVQPLPARQ